VPPLRRWATPGRTQVEHIESTSPPKERTPSGHAWAAAWGQTRSCRAVLAAVRSSLEADVRSDQGAAPSRHFREARPLDLTQRMRVSFRGRKTHVSVAASARLGAKAGHDELLSGRRYFPLGAFPVVVAVVPACCGCGGGALGADVSIRIFHCPFSRTSRAVQIAFISRGSPFSLFPVM